MPEFDAGRDIVFSSIAVKKSDQVTVGCQRYFGGQKLSTGGKGDMLLPNYLTQAVESKQIIADTTNHIAYIASDIYKKSTVGQAKCLIACMAFFG